MLKVVIGVKAVTKQVGLTSKANYRVPDTKVREAVNTI